MSANRNSATDWIVNVACEMYVQVICFNSISSVYVMRKCVWAGCRHRYIPPVSSHVYRAHCSQGWREEDVLSGLKLIPVLG